MTPPCIIFSESDENFHELPKTSCPNQRANKSQLDTQNGVSVSEEVESTSSFLSALRYLVIRLGEAEVGPVEQLRTGDGQRSRKSLQAYT